MCVYNAEDIAQQLHNAISTEKCKNVVFNPRACASKMYMYTVFQNEYHGT